MHSRLRLIPLVLLAVTICAHGQAAPKKIRILLVGDSTMQPKSGYGPGFCADMAADVECVNLARGGRSSGSYRAEGLWDKVMPSLKEHNADYAATYVLIQFGHNDQPGKPGRSTDLATEFPVNMRRYVEDVKSTGAKPVLVTPLTRRQFNKDGTLNMSLEPWAEATRKVAAETHTPLIDLLYAGAAAVEAMGPDEANTLAMAPPPPPGSEPAAMPASSTAAPASSPTTPASSTTAPAAAGSPATASGPAQGIARTEPKGEAPPKFDYTHLGAKGSVYFGRMVADLLAQACPELKPHIKP